MHNSTVWLDKRNRIYAIYYYKKNRTTFRIFFEKHFTVMADGDLAFQSRDTVEYNIKSLYVGMNC